MHSTPQMNQVRPEEAEVIRVLYQARDSAELRAVVQFARAKQASALAQLLRSSGLEELVKYQQQYSAWEGLVKTILTPSPVVSKISQGDRT